MLILKSWPKMRPAFTDTKIGRSPNSSVSYRISAHQPHQIGV
jgi:hypothetical protein